MIAIGVDVGGTQTRAAAVDADGRILASRRTVTPCDTDGSAIVHWIAEAIRSLAAEQAAQEVGRVPPAVSPDHAPSSTAATRGIPSNGVQSPPYVGIALPGIIDRERGLLRRSVNLPFLQDRPIVTELERATCHKVALFTDAEAATWGEYRALPLPARNFVHLRIGTGVACGVVIDGRLHPHEPDRTGHLDELIVDHSESATPCRCGKRGCLEALVSGPILLEHARRIAPPSTGKDAGPVPPAISLDRAYRSTAATQTDPANGGQSPPYDLSMLELAVQKEDAAAGEIVARAAEHVVTALSTLARRYAPQAIVLGGGVIAHLPSLYITIAHLWTSTIHSHANTTPCQLHSYKLGDDAGVIGAALLAVESCQEPLQISNAAVRERP